MARVTSHRTDPDLPTPIPFGIPLPNVNAGALPPIGHGYYADSALNRPIPSRERVYSLPALMRGRYEDQYGEPLPAPHMARFNPEYR